MPIYEYRCEGCQTLTEVIQKFADDPLTTCEKCGGKLERLVSAPGLHFKGSGWYITDYGRGGQKPPADSKPAKPATETKSSTTSESKPAKPAATASKSD